jgi:signal transduction histidine kinase
MRSWLRGPRGGLILFLLITGLVGGGLGWMTAAVLHLEREQQRTRAESELAANLRLAVLRLDSCVAPDLAREEGRLYNHYSFISRHPLTLVQRNQRLVTDATVLPISPLLTEELPDWMLLHFQADESGWSSPQVPPADLFAKLTKYTHLKSFRNRTEERKVLLAQLKKGLPAKTLLAALEIRGRPTLTDRPVILVQDNNKQQVQIQPQQQFEPQSPQFNQDFRGQGSFQQGGQPLNPFDRNGSRRLGQGRGNLDQQNVVTENEGNILNDIRDQGANWLNTANIASNPSMSEASLKWTPLEWAWLKTGEDRENLVLIREVIVERNRKATGDNEKLPTSRICQGIVLNLDMLRQYLTEEVQKDLPGATLEPVHDPEQADRLRTMTLLPLSLEPAPMALPPIKSWTPLRIGLALAWMAAGVALLAVGFAGWSLIDLSERRFRFVSAVTHELRTPLTTLRLYLDMLLGGLVRDERQKEEYIRTLHDEADRLSRLVNNVLDFSRLEKQRPRVRRTPVFVQDLLGQVRDTWQGRCQDVGKLLVVETELPPETEILTDPELVQQVVANLIDNACKYSRDAEEPHIWLRARQENGRVVFEVEDRGPGIPARERRAIFRAFRRGRVAEATGGVGLGLALAQRWSRLLGGRLALRCSGPGACFRLEL